MKINSLFYILSIVIILFLNSCATSMSPIQVNRTLPALTKSKFISQVETEKIISTNSCKYLVKGRKYNAPMGLSTNHDLKNAAKGIDEWVALDEGNSYVLINYQWVTVDQYGSTQLQVEFDTMLCE
ncbi:MAG: hypothetical protein WAT92_19710 [Saprospiraceae bacterium]